MELNTLLWDMDGTLLDSEPAHEQAFYAAVAELGLQVAPDFHDACLGLSVTDVHARLCAATGAQLTLAHWKQVKWQHYRRHGQAIQAIAGRVALLEQLAEQGVPMAVVTNSTRDEADFNLDVSGLAGFFPVTVSRDDVERGKPAPDSYLLAAKRLDVTAAQCLVIEDSPNGARAGLAAGMHTLFHPETVRLLDQCPPGARLLEPGGDLPGLLQQLGIME
ncbi:MAG: HAD family phosphatase [Thiolinea sp.]